MSTLPSNGDGQAEMTERERGRGRVRIDDAEVDRRETQQQHDDDEAPTKTLFPDEPLPLSSLQGDWTLIASTAPIWQARRDVGMTISEQSDSSPMKATWSFYEIGSFKAKTLLTRIAEHRRHKNAQRDLKKRPGENRESQSGIVFEDEEHCFYYTAQKSPLATKRIKWEVIGWGDDSSSVEWFIAYIHNQPLISPPFISVYVRGGTSMEVRALFNDVVDELKNIKLDAHEKNLLALQYELRRMARELKLVRGI